MFKIISSSSNPHIKQIIKLRKEKKVRSLERKMLIVGKNALNELAKTQKIDTLIITDKRLSGRFPGAKNTLLVSKKIMKQITNVSSPEEVAAVIDFPQNNIKNKNYVLILDNISDPGNIGTLIRSAAAFDFDLVICTQNCTDPYGEKALRSAKGATFLLPIITLSDNEIITFTQEHKLKLYLADLNGKKISDIDFSPPYAIVLSNEALGPSEFFKPLCEKITIPISSHMDSLNVASAGSICMYIAKGQK